MLIEFFNGFVKVTGWPAQKLIFRTKIYYEDKQAQGRPLYIVEGYYGYGSEEHPNRTRSPIRKINH